MPSWCNNCVFFYHSDPMILKTLWNGFYDETLEHRGLFHSMVPLPKILRNTVSGSTSDKEVKLKREEQYKRNTEEYGFPTWYEFCNAKWGTKWDVYNKSDIVEDFDTDGFELKFECAWSPPIEFYKAISKLGFVVDAKFIDEGNNYYGYWREEDEKVYDLKNFYDDYDDIPSDLKDFVKETCERIRYNDEEEYDYNYEE